MYTTRAGIYGRQLRHNSMRLALTENRKSLSRSLKAFSASILRRNEKLFPVLAMLLMLSFFTENLFLM